jgi:hypothetical protein
MQTPSLLRTMRDRWLPRPARRTARRTAALATALLALTAGLVMIPPDAASGAPARQLPPGAFLDTFDGKPSVPTPWHGAGWDVTVHSRNRETWQQLEPMAAGHGADCSAPPASHMMTEYDDAVFQCNGHVMTSINAGGYGVIYLTPNQMVDISGGEAVVSFDLSTLRTSPRDWIDLWVTPYEDQLQLPLETWLPDLTGEPRRSVHARLDLTTDMTAFKGFVYRENNTSEELPLHTWQGYESVLTPSAVRRDTVELRISRTSVKLGMPQYNFWWIDTKIADLGWDRGVVQFGHHSYAPTKCDTRCSPNTWHWDNVMIAPAVPFTIIPADRRVASEALGPAVQFEAPAPPDSHLRFVAAGSGLQVSFDGGGSWQPAQPRPPREGKDPYWTVLSYWTPMPAGATGVMLRGNDWGGGAWNARDFSIWSLEPPADASAAAPAE